MKALEEHSDHVLLRLRVQPKASRNALCVESDGRIRVALTAPPVDGAANKALCKFLSSFLEVPKSAVSLVGGGKSRDKTVRCLGGIPEKLRVLMEKSDSK
jgi:uncharacterized protein (TIGR00251 family)